MASISYSPVTFTGNLASGTPASDLLGNGVSGLPLKALGRARLGVTRRDFTVSAKIKKVRKRNYPWPANPDPNIEGGILRHLSSFKPLKEKPKPVILEFERPLLNLQKKIVDVQRMATETGLDFTEQIMSLEKKYQQALKDLYTHLTPIQRVYIARHPNRPTFLDHVFCITDKFLELHGDRCGYDDPAIVTGLGSIDGRTYMFIGHQKGRNTKENIQRNFGMPTPHGYRKALRMFNYADHHGFPIVSFIDTPGAFADIKSEELNQGEAIANNLRTMFGLKVPIITIVIGEGGSGGALAIGCANKMLMLENAVFYVASPEACAAILWKSAKAAPKAAKRLRITARELCKLKIADGVIPEPLGGAHADPKWTSQQIKQAILKAMDELVKMDTEELLKHRSLKYRNIGGFTEAISIDPIKTRNMKKREVPATQLEMEAEVEKLRQQIMKAKKPSSELPVAVDKMIDKLKEEVNREYAVAAKAMGLNDRIKMLRKEYEEVKNSKDEAMKQAVAEKIVNLEREFDQGLSGVPNYPRLKSKLDMLNEMYARKDLLEKKSKADMMENKALKQKIGETSDMSNEMNEGRFLSEKKDKADVKEKKRVTLTKAELSARLDQLLKDKISQVKQLAQIRFAGVLQYLDCRVNPPVSSDVKVKVEEFDKLINQVIDDAADSSDLKNMMEQFKLMGAKVGGKLDEESKSKMLYLSQQIRQILDDAAISSVLRETYEELEVEISQDIESSGNLDGGLNHGNNIEGGNSNFDESRVEVNMEANRS